jgi:hypothetical protein
VSAWAPYGPRIRLPSRIQDAKTTQSAVKRSNPENQTWAYSAPADREATFSRLIFSDRGIHPRDRTPKVRTPGSAIFMREPPRPDGPAGGLAHAFSGQPNGKTTNGSNPNQCLSCPVCPSLPAPGRWLGGSEKWAVAFARAEHRSRPPEPREKTPAAARLDEQCCGRLACSGWYRRIMQCADLPGGRPMRSTAAARGLDRLAAISATMKLSGLRPREEAAATGASVVSTMPIGT